MAEVCGWWMTEVGGLWMAEVAGRLSTEVGCNVLVEVLVRKILSNQMVYFLKICLQANTFLISGFCRGFRNLSLENFLLIMRGCKMSRCNRGRSFKT